MATTTLAFGRIASSARNGILTYNNPDAYYVPQLPKITYSTLPPFQLDTGNEMHAVTGDPQFVDATMMDFRLKPTSPCIDTGDPLAPVPADGGSRVDIGAYEKAVNLDSSVGLLYFPKFLLC